ncbi:MAG: type II secretion system protein [Planctomycetes bacterium]|nr:type II secretion system protein [Planctomycetota bacterium]
MEAISSKKHKGFSLVESMIALVILGFAASAVVVPFSSGSKVRAEGMRRTLAACLASDMIEQALSEDFDDIVSNYNYSESKGQIKNYQGSNFTDSRYSKFSRQVVSQEVYVSQEDGNFDAKFIRITVVVYYDDLEMVTINRLVSE